MAFSLETYVIDIIEGRRKSPFVRAPLRFAALLFGLAVRMRHRFADHGEGRGKRAVPLPVISIGNIVAGGTGKTALVRKIGKDLPSALRPAVLLRGYRSEVERSGGNLLLRPHTDLPAEVCGDEALLLQRAHPRLCLIVGKNRLLSAQKAVREGADLILLDDGLQYRKLRRDIEVIVLHGDDPYGKGHYLPRGYLRDTPERLRHADYLFVNHVRDLSRFSSLKKELEKKTDAPLIAMRPDPAGIEGEGILRQKGEGERVVAVFCGLGNPTSFLRTVTDMGYSIRSTMLLPDHRAPTRDALRNFALRARAEGCERILCSDKDRVKLADPSAYALPIHYVKISLKIVAGQKYYERLLRDIISLAKMRKAL
ncbi:MAG: tetraacyldisaccharide 4'-kinase [Simkaniaceae bacterium]|nr:tetraacyldisaccharide 4'-kinase [Simkaniaceae bacterium]